MSLCNVDFPLDAFDERHAAEKQARVACEQLIDDDESSLVSDKARLVVALYVVAGSLALRVTQAELADMLGDLAQQVARDGIVVQHGRIMSLD